MSAVRQALGFVVVGLIVVFLVAEAELVESAQEVATALTLAWISCSLGVAAIIPSFLYFQGQHLFGNQKKQTAGGGEGTEAVADRSLNGDVEIEVMAAVADDVTAGLMVPDLDATVAMEAEGGEKIADRPLADSFVAEVKASMAQDNLTLRYFVSWSIVLGLIFFVDISLYFFALGATTAANAVTIYNTCTAFVYAFSLCLLKEKVDVVKLLAVVLSILGVALVSFGDVLLSGSSGEEEQSEGDDSSHLVGDFAAFVSALLAGLYFVLFKKIIGEGENLTVSLYTCLSGFTALICGAPFLSYQLYHINWAFPSLSLTLVMLLACCCGFVINYLLNAGIALTGPLFIAIGCMLSVPGTAIADFFLRHIALNVLQLIGITVVIIGFLLLNIDVKALWRKLRQRMVGGDSQPLRDPDEELL